LKLTKSGKPLLAIKKNVMQKTESLQHGQYYHIYNCGINGERLFREQTNYEYFLRLYEKYIDPIAETIAWCLMGNHFHLLVRIKEVDEINAPPDRVRNPVRGEKPLHLHFSHLFNAYTQAYNKMYSRHGSLFERPFKRKHIDNEIYLKQVVLYIHNNPVHHGFYNHPDEYAWSSYMICISSKPTKIMHTPLINEIDSEDYLKSEHLADSDFDVIEAFLDFKS
jgi:putative transposase